VQSQSLPSPIIAPCSQYIPTYLHTKKKKPLASILEFNCPDWAVLAYFCCLCRARETEREQLSCCSKIERAENLEVIRFSWLSVYRSIACSYRSHFGTGVLEHVPPSLISCCCILCAQINLNLKSHDYATLYFALTDTYETRPPTRTSASPNDPLKPAVPLHLRHQRARFSLATHCPPIISRSLAST
jgi:hypothetical protein